MGYYSQSYIKVPEGIVKIARENGIYRSLMFWYRLKPINQLGKFDKNSFYKTVKYFYNISDSNIRLHLNKLLKMGLIKDYKSSYQLVSYDKLFKHFGYNLKLKKKNGKVIRKGNFAITKIENFYIDDSYLEDIIDCSDIQINLRRQDDIIRKAQKGNPMSNTFKKIVDKKNSGSGIYDNLNIELSKRVVSEIKNTLNIEIGQKKINPITGISCRRIAKILGYKSTKSVHDLKKRSVANELIQIIPQKIILKNYTGFMDEVLIKYHLKDFHFKYGINQPISYQLHDDFLFGF